MTPLKIYKASAGSGKTFTLAVEYIALLAMDPMEYQHILAVTFTNKATAEMKQRILSTLYGIAHGLSGTKDYVASILQNLEERKEMPLYQEEPYRSILQTMNEAVLRQRAKEALSNIIHDYSRFHVETIDSFFQSIVREIASELELSTNMRVELDEKEVLGDAIDQIMERLKENSSEFRSIIEFIEEKIRTGRSWQVDGTVKEFGQNIFKENYLIHGEDVRKKITDVGELHRYRTIIQQLLDEKQRAVTTQGRQLLEAYTQCGMTEKDGTAAMATFLGKVADEAFTKPTSKLFSEAIERYTTDADKWLKKSSKQRETLLPQVENVLMPMLKELFALHNAYLSHRHTVTAIGQHLYSLMLLNRISATVKTMNEEAGRFLLSETANFLRGVIHRQDIPFIYEKTGAVIRHIMIDEFQDTSTLQWGNFKPLIQNSLATGGTCLIVGDVKQSIYRFRNSDWQILNHLEHDSDLTGYISTIPAEYNYRSAPQVVAFNNHFFEHITQLLKADCPALETAYRQLEQKPKQTGSHGFVRLENIDYHDVDTEHQPHPWDKQTPPLYEEATLQRVQLTVNELMDNGVNPSDITILTRTNREVPLISDYFASHQDVLSVNIVSDDAFRLDASPAILLLIDALRALATPDDTLRLTTLAHHYQTLVLNHRDSQLRPSPQPSPIMGRETNRMALPLHGGDVRQDREGPLLTPNSIDPYLPQGMRQAERHTLRLKALTELIEDLHPILQLSRLSGQDAHLLYFHDIVAEHCSHNPTDLDTFLLAWDEQLHTKTIPNGAMDGVRIMTVHKSKGLEFHTVIIPSCSWNITPNPHEVIWCVPTEKPYSQMPLLPVSVSKATPDSLFSRDREAEQLKTLVDNINVLYVAFTRAKNNLIILTGNKLEAKNPNSSLLTPNSSLLTPNSSLLQPLLLNAIPPSAVQTDIDGCVTLHQWGTIVASRPTPHPTTEAPVDTNVLEATYHPLPLSFVSHPSVATFRQSNASDLFLTADAPHPATQLHAQRLRLISLGNLYHLIFQHIHTPADVPHAIRLLESKGCFGTLLEAHEARAAVTQMLKHITPQHPEWFSPDWHVISERAILHTRQGQPHLKRPDRVIVQGTHAILIDYKTALGAVRPQADGTFLAPTEHRQQMEDYKNLLAQMGYTDVKAFLWYVLDGIVVPS